MIKVLRNVKNLIFLLAGVLILLINEGLKEYLGLLIGGVMLLFAAEGLLARAIHLKEKEQLPEFIGDAVLLLLSVLLLLVWQDFEKVCVIWAVWSILREAEETTEVLTRYRKKSVMVIDLLESLTVTVLSFFLVLDPAEHVTLHIYILGIEMLLEVIFPFLDGYEKLEQELD